jgi:serine/threonine protein phosphatase PrpC
VTSEPDIVEIARTDGQKIVLACDGVWDVLNELDIQGLLNQCKERNCTDPASIAQLLTNKAVIKESKDNVTSMVVDFAPCNVDEKVVASCVEMMVESSAAISKLMIESNKTLEAITDERQRQL